MNLREREDEGDSKTTHNVTDEVLAVVLNVSDHLVAHEVEDTLLQVREKQIQQTCKTNMYTNKNQLYFWISISSSQEGIPYCYF